MRLLFLLTLSFTVSCVMGQDTLQKLTITHLTKDYYIFTTYGNAGNGKMLPANGMYLVTDKGVILFDTPWDSTQFQPLLDSIYARHHQKVLMCIVTHFHDDRTAGLNYYNNLGIKTYSTKLTDKLAKLHHEPRATNLLNDVEVYQAGQYTFEVFYPGKGHSPDNIVIWFHNEGILYGGCFVKSGEATDLGNLTDADPHQWIRSIKKVQSAYKKPHFIIPGHRSWLDTNSLNHTMYLLTQYELSTKK